MDEVGNEKAIVWRGETESSHLIVVRIPKADTLDEDIITDVLDSDLFDD